MAKEITWLSEDEASTLLGLKPRTIRQYVANGRMNIDFSRPHYRKILYSKESIDKYLISCSTLTTKKPGVSVPANY